ncbi:MAG TPA: hypothetical protein VHY77_03140 [Acidimicrobiales bacterium]|nr:hypothetical protein [Acidimicrobiales bacterium]
MQRMEQRRQRATEHGGAGSRPDSADLVADLGWVRLQSAVDEAEAESFPASDPQSSWAGPDRASLPWGDAEQ